MRPVEVNVADIIQAGKDLLAANRNITGFALRKAVGGGSAPRLRQVWDDYLDSKSISKVESVAELPVEVASELKELSDGLVRKLEFMAVSLNDKAVKASERRVSDLVKSVGEQQAQSERELADASNTVDELEEQLIEAENGRELLSVQLADASSEKQKLAIEVAQLSERLAAAEERAQTAGAQVAFEAERSAKAREDAARSAGQIEAMGRQVKELMAKVAPLAK